MKNAVVADYRTGEIVMNTDGPIDRVRAWLNKEQSEGRYEDCRVISIRKGYRYNSDTNKIEKIAE